MPNIFDPRHQANNPASKLLFALDRVAEVIRVQLWDKAKELQLTPLQIRVILFLAGHQQDGLNNVSALAKTFQLTKPTVSETIRLLLKKSLIIKVKDPADGRAFDLQLSAKGKAVVKEASTFSRPLEQALIKLAPEQQSGLYQHLFELLVGFQSAGLIPVQRMCTNCRHFTKRDEMPYCTFLDQALNVSDFRVDCPEFAPTV